MRFSQYMVCVLHTLYNINYLIIKDVVINDLITINSINDV